MLSRFLIDDRRGRGELPFSEKGVEEVYRIYRINAQYVGLRDSDDVGGSGEPVGIAATAVEIPPPQTPEPKRVPQPAQPAPAGPAENEVKFRLRSGRHARVLYPSDATEEEVQQIMEMLKMDFEKSLEIAVTSGRHRSTS